MIRKIAAISLAVSFVALASSGLMMFVIGKPSFTLQMHPVHKLFGLLMIVATIAHICVNYRVFINHLKIKSAAIYGIALVAILIFLYAVAMNHKVPESLAQKMDSAVAEAESKH